MKRNGSSFGSRCTTYTSYLSHLALTMPSDDPLPRYLAHASLAHARTLARNLARARTFARALARAHEQAVQFPAERLVIFSSALAPFLLPSHPPSPPPPPPSLPPFYARPAHPMQRVSDRLSRGSEGSKQRLPSTVSAQQTPTHPQRFLQNWPKRRCLSPTSPG